MFGFFKNLISGNDHQAPEPSQEYKPKPPINDKRGDKCPYCQVQLDKVPGAKTKCKSCGNYIYVRTLRNRDKVLCTDEEMRLIDFEDFEYELLKWIDDQVWLDDNKIREALKDYYQTIKFELSATEDRYNHFYYWMKLYIKMGEIAEQLPASFDHNSSAWYCYKEAAFYAEKLNLDSSKYKKLSEKYAIKTDIEFK